MDNRKDVHDFLVSRRTKVSPAQAGLPTYDDKRRVPGLRREEVASLAGVSFDYYARLERGNLSGVSEPALESLARVLQLDEAERGHLFDLARMAATRVRAARARKPSPAKVRPSVAGILTGMTGVPAYVRNARMDILAANDLCCALYTGVLDQDRMPVNLARYVFLDHRSTGFFLDWEAIADDVAGTLRGEVGRHHRSRAQRPRR